MNSVRRLSLSVYSMGQTEVSGIRISGLKSKPALEHEIKGHLRSGWCVTPGCLTVGRSILGNYSTSKEAQEGRGYQQRVTQPTQKPRNSSEEISVELVLALVPGAQQGVTKSG